MLSRAARAETPTEPDSLKIQTDTNSTSSTEYENG